MEFSPSSKPTVGIEWEVALTDPTSRDLVPRGTEVLAYLDQHHEGHRVVAEFLNNTVEMVTGIHQTIPSALEDLKESLTQVFDAADSLGVAPFSAGTHPFAHWADQQLMTKDSYNEIIERTQWWGRQMLIWGVHVHVGVNSRDKVFPLINALMTLYPHILSLSASSPAWLGTDTGYASNRTMLYQQLPTAGLPYQFEDWEQWEEFNLDQQKSGVTNHTGFMHFDIRPTAFGTIEVRFADATMALWELGALGAFIHCAVIYFDRLYDEDPAQLPTLQQWHLVENKWRAARYGLDSLVIVDRNTNEVLVTEDIAQWVKKFEPIAQEFGCAYELADVQHLIDQGGDYQRQRATVRQNGAALQPGTRVRTGPEDHTNFSNSEAWIPAVDLVTTTLRESIE